MCSVLVFIKPDNVHPDPTQDWRKYKLGDVMEVREEEDFDFGLDVRGPKAMGWLTSINLPGVPAGQLAYLTEEEPDNGKDQPRRMRVNKIDFLSLANATPATKDALASNLPLTVAKADLLAVASVKPPVVIAANPLVFA